MRARRRDDLLGPAGGEHAQGVEEGAVLDLEAAGTQRLGQHRGVAVGAGRDRLQPLGAVVDGVHGGDHGEQHLCGADVGGRLVAADVLLAGLQGEPVGGAALDVDGDADESTGQVPLQALGDGHEAGVRAAVEQRHPEPLGRPDHDVGPELSRRLEQRQRQQVGGHHDEGVALVGRIDQRARVDARRPDAPG